MSWYKQTWGIYLIILGGLLVLALGIGFWQFYSYRQALIGGEITKEEFSAKFGVNENEDFEIDVEKYFESAESVKVKALAGSAPSFGSKDASVVIVAFEDFYCSHCQDVFPEVKEILSSYGDKINFIYRQFPLLGNTDAAVASLCADEQGMFWPFHDLLYQSQVGLGGELYASLATQLGLNQNRFSNCLVEETYKAKIQADVAVGQAYGASATPTLFINGFKIAGEFKASQITPIIDYLLEYYSQE